MQTSGFAKQTCGLSRPRLPSIIPSGTVGGAPWPQANSAVQRQCPPNIPVRTE